MSWLFGLLAAWRETVRVKVTLDGVLGLDSPHNSRPYVVTVINKSRTAIGVNAAGIFVISPEGEWELPGEPLLPVTIEGQHSASWTVTALTVSRHLQGKGLDEAAIKGLARLGTGKTRMSRARTVSRR